MANLLKEQIELIGSGRPFFAYREPGSAEIFMYPGSGNLSFGPVSVCPWPGSGISDLIPERSTPRAEYIHALTGLIASLSLTGGKAAIQRVITGEFAAFDAPALVAEFFGAPTPTLDFVLYDPAVGYWLGRSPELLLESTDGYRFDTRALAGTRPAEERCDWSEKNIHEHQGVVDDITCRLDALGLEVSTGVAENFTCGAVTHILTPISACSAAPSRDLFRKIIAELHPTPAVGGYPRAEAMQQIESIESTPRELYGGVINIADRRAYVVLRCAHFNSRRWAIYTGSGVTPESSPAEEWDETQAKAAPLIQFLSRF